MKINKRLLSLALACVAVSGVAQIIEVEEIRRIELPEGVTAYDARLSPKGNFVVAGALTDDGLNRIDLNTSAVTRISDSGSTLDLSISTDGRRVAYRRGRINANHLRMVSVEQFDFTTGKTTTLVAPTRNLQGFRVDDNAIVSIDNGIAKTRRRNAASKDDFPVASVRYGSLWITKGAESHNISPQGAEGNSYLWPAVSPDGTKVVYYLASVGTYVCDIDGGNPVYVGELRAPAWYGNDVVIGMTDRDDGRVVTSSRIVAARIDGAATQTLTDSSVRAMYPSADASGSQISFTTPEGFLYIIKIKK